MDDLQPALSAALDRAVAACNAGRLVEAEELCRQIVNARHDFFDALHLLALVQSMLGKKEDALASFDRALDLQPEHAEVLANRGAALHELKRFEEALAGFDRALALRPDLAEAHSNRGNTLRELGRFAEAIASYDRALALRPRYAEALSNRGVTLHRGQRFEEALASFDRALGLRPDYPEALSNRGNVLRNLGRAEEALASYDRALALRPDYAEALSNRGVILHELKRFEEALASCDRALALRPHYAEALCNRGVALNELNRFEEALASYDRALALRPNYPVALSNRGNTLRELKRFEEALASYGRAVALRPNYAPAHHNEALCRLLVGDFERGWEKCEWRRELEHTRARERRFAQPLLRDLNAVAGKTVLLYGEQGLGDMIQFCRYVPLVAEHAAHVILQIPRALHGLMSTLSGAPQIISVRDPPPPFDERCPLLSLPLAFGTRLETIPSTTPYLHASLQAVTRWNARLGPRGRPRIGLVWSGRPTNRNDRNRSIGLAALLPLLDVDATFVSLQHEVRADDAQVLADRSDLLHFGDDLKDFADTAALVLALDLVISVDTSVAHLAGALAKPVWVLLPFIPDWRWLLDRDDSPWYPTARLFRQDHTRAWDHVIAHACGALRDFVQDCKMRSG
jgi:tetratricopeptide (TPR) repeat protein